MISSYKIACHTKQNQTRKEDNIKNEFLMKRVAVMINVEVQQPVK